MRKVGHYKRKTFIRTILNDKKSSKIWLHGTRKAWRGVELKILPYSTIVPTAITALVAIESEHSSGRYSPSFSIWWNLHYNANVIAALNNVENASREPYVVIDEDQVIYDSNVWVYGNDFTSEEPVTVQVTLEEVPLSEIGKIESLSRVATYMGIRNPV